MTQDARAGRRGSTSCATRSAAPRRAAAASGASASTRGQAHRPRAGRAAPRRGHLRGAGQARRAPLPRLRHGRAEGPRRRRRLRLRPHRRAPRLRLRPGLHRLRGQPLRDQRPEDLQGHGPRDEDGRARSIGLNDSGGARIQEGVASLGRLRRHLPAQHPRLGRRAADLGHPRPLRRRRRLQPRHHRLQRDGEGHLLHVRDRARRHQDRDPRGGHQGGAGRRHDPQREVGRGPLRGGRRPGLPRPHSRAALLPALEQPRGAAPPQDRGPAGPRGPGPRHPHPRRGQQALRHQAPDRGASWTTRRFLEVHEHFAPNIVVGFARFGGRSVGIVANQPAVPRGLPGHRRLGEGGALRPLLRRLQHPARHLRGRPGLPARHRPGVRRASSATGPSCSTPSPRPPSPRSRSSPARPTAAPTA